MDAPRTIASLIYPDVMSLDVTGPLQVFASANVERQRQGLPPLTTCNCSPMSPARSVPRPVFNWWPMAVGVSVQPTRWIHC